MSKINEVNSDSHETTGFFTNVAGYVLPPETWKLVNGDYGKAEMRVVLCLLLSTFEIGHQAEVLSFNDLVELTEMSKASVSKALKLAKGSGLVLETTLGYQIALKIAVSKSEPMSCHESLKHDLNTNIDHDSCHGFTFGNSNSERQKIFERLSKSGLAPKVAHDIAFAGRYSLERIEQQLDYYEFEVENELLPANCWNLPGYLVNRIKFNKQAPKEPTKGKTWYSGEEFDQLMEK